MRNEVKIGLVVLGSAAAGILGAWLFFSAMSGSTEKSAQEQRLAKCVRSGSVKKITEISVDRKAGKKSVRIVESEATRPNVIEDADIDDVDKLSDVQRSVLNEIQAALDADDYKALKKALSKLTASVKSGGLGGYANVPRVIRAAAVQALGWFGKAAALDLVDFMADSDAEISSDAFDQFDFALQDVDMSDFERAAIVKTTAKALTDPDWIDSLLMCLNDMRNSVKGATAISIITEGTPQVKAALLENIDFYLDEGISNADDVRKWMEENPDDPEDEEFYGGEK
jgi:hypothetical protein